ncbi:MAG: glycosyltransferase [Bifidobacteriaceae bacterium]|nr:glycosyltransferase [Bifidobacteriaceae bacterium]
MTVCDQACERPNPLSPAAGPAPSVALVSLHTSPVARAGVGDAGGMNVYLRSVSRELARAGWRVDVYTRATSPEEAARGSERIGDATLHYLHAGPPAPVEKDALAALADEFAAAMAARTPADVVHSHYWLSGLAGEQAARAWGAPHIQSLHTVAAIKNRDLAPGDSPESAARLEGERRLVRTARGVVTVSEAERQAIIRDYGARPDRVRVVSPGVDGAVFRPGPAPDPAALPAPLRRDAGYLLMAGRVQPIKGQDLAIRTLARLDPARRPALLVTGAPGQGHLEYAASLRTLAREEGVAGDVVFWGPQSPGRLAGLMRGARLTLLPSRSETFGLVAVESAACGTPVIGSDTTGLRSSVAHGVTGLLLASRDPAVWADGIGRVLGDPAFAARLGQGGVEAGRSRTWADVAAALAALYGSLARAHAGR